MLDFASPVWLWSALAVVIPLALHLLSQGQRRRIRVGSVKLLQAARSRRFRRFRLHDLPLLLLRGALLGLVALLLARPQGLRPLLHPTAARGWVLAEPEFLAARPLLEREQRQTYAALDALVAKGTPLHVLSNDFPEAAGAPAAVDGRPENVWSWLREADRLMPDGATLWVFTLDRLAALGGRRPVLRSRVEWQVASGAGPERWLQRAPAPASLPAPPRVPVTVAFSARREDDAHLVQAALQAAAATARVEVPIRLEPAKDMNGSPAADILFWLAEQPVPPAILESVSRGLVLVRDAAGDRFDEDRSRLLLDWPQPGGPPRVFRRWAGVQPATGLDGGEGAPPGGSAGAVSGGPAGASGEAREGAPPDESPGALSGGPAGASGEGREGAPAGGSAGAPPAGAAGTLPAGAAGGSAEGREGAPPRGRAGHAPGGQEGGRREERGGGPPGGPAGVPIWRDGFGRPLLTLRRLGAGQVWSLQGRFDPRWSELVLQPAFPEWLAELVASVHSAPPPADRRGVAPLQRQPEQGEAEAGSAAPEAPPGLDLPLGLLVLALFAAERWWSCRRVS